MQSLLKHWIDQRGNRAALVDSHLGTIHWQQLGRMVGSAKSILAEFDLSIPIVHRCQNHCEDIITALAVAELGGIEAPIDYRVGADEFDRRLERLGGQLLHPRQKHHFLDESAAQGVSRKPSGELVAGVILWTSGTTSSPQGVHLSYSAWLSNATAKLAAVPQHEADLRLTVLPISHAYARTCDLGTWLLSGSTLAITLGFDGLVRAAAQVRPTLLNCVPSMAHRLLDEESSVEGMERLRLLGVGGAPLSVEAFHAWKRRGVKVIQGYGLTETGPVICSATPENASPGLVGDFVDGWEHRIVDGELHVRGSHAMEGYWNDEVATTQKRDQANWIRTGDEVQWDNEQKQLRVLGRIDDVIVLENGRKLHPMAIERSIEHGSGVRHAMLVQRQQLELWIDGEESLKTTIAKQLQKHHLRCDIRFFDPPLSFAAGELTAKQTIRRQVIKKRLEQ